VHGCSPLLAAAVPLCPDVSTASGDTPTSGCIPPLPGRCAEAAARAAACARLMRAEADGLLLLTPAARTLSPVKTQGRHGQQAVLRGEPCVMSL
jgi:hypothetical protein